MVFALAGDSTMTRFLANRLLFAFMMPHEEGPGQPAHLVLQLQFGETGQERRRFKAAALLQLVEARRATSAGRKDAASP